MRSQSLLQKKMTRENRPHGVPVDAHLESDFRLVGAAGSLPRVIRAAQAQERQVFTDQSPFAVRFEWGERGLDAISPGCAVIVIVDVFSFCTSVDLATSRGAAILPYHCQDETAPAFAENHQAILAGK